MTENSDAAVARLVADLAPIGVRARAMFGGYGLYLGDKFFGIVNDGRVFFRTDDESQREYIARGMPPFQPNNRPIGPKTVARNFQVPDDVLSNPEVLVEWALRAAQAR